MKRYSLPLRCFALAVISLLLLQDVLWANPDILENKPYSLQIPSIFSGRSYDYIKIPFKLIVAGGSIESLNLPLSLKVGSRADTPFYAFNGKYIENGCWVVPCTVRDDKTGKALINCEIMDTGQDIKLRNIKIQALEEAKNEPEMPKREDDKAEAEKEKFLLQQIGVVKNWNVSSEERISAVRTIHDEWVKAGSPEFNDMLGRLDLHNHTIFSDGQFTPAYLVLANWFRGVSGMSITDHNTFDAMPEAMEVADILGMTLVPGIELAVFDRDIPAEKFHCVAYWKGTTAGFKEWTLSESGRRWITRIRNINEIAARKMEAVRQEYNRRYVGLEITQRDVFDMFPSGAVKRTDLARVIFKKYGSLALGVDDIHRTKEKFLKNIKTDIHDAEYTFNINEIKELCAENGFRFVMVHPLVRSKWDIVQVEEIYRKHAPFFDGVEIWHSSASDGQMKSLEDMVGRLNRLIYKDRPLIVTIGSDTHGKFDKRFGFNMSSRTELGRQAIDGSFRASGILQPAARKRYIAQLLLHWGLSDKSHRTLIDITPVCKLIDDDVLNELKSLAYSDRRKKAAAFMLRALIKGRLLGDPFVDKARQIVAAFREAPARASSREPSYFEKALQQQKDIFIGKEPADTAPTPSYKTYYKDEPKLQDYFIEISKMNIELIKLLAERTRYKRKGIGGLLLDTTVQNIKDKADKLMALADSIEDPTHPYKAEIGNVREKIRSDLRRAAELVRGEDNSAADPAHRSNEMAACAKLVGCAASISSEMEYLIRKRTERHPGYPRKRVSSRSGILYVRHGRRINIQVSPSSSVSFRVSDEQPYELISEAISAHCKEVKSQIDELRLLKETVSRFGSLRKELLVSDITAYAALVEELAERLKKAQVPAKVVAYYAALTSKELMAYEEPQPGLIDMTIGVITKFLILRINELSRMIESTRDGKLQDLRDEEDELIGDSESLVASVLDAVKGNKVSDAVKTIEYVTHAKQLKGLRRFFDDSNWRFMKKYLGKAKVMLGKDDLTGARETLEKAKDRIKKGKAMTGTVRGIYEAYFESNLFGKKVSLEEVFERTFLEYFVRSGLNKASPEERIRRAALWRIELYQFVFIPYRIEQPSSGKNNKEKVFNPFHLALSHFIKVAYGNPSMSIARALEETVNMFGSGASFRHNALLKPQQIDQLRHIILSFDIHSILELPEQFPAEQYRFDFKSKFGWVVVDKGNPTIFFTRSADGVWGNGNAPSGGIMTNFQAPSSGQDTLRRITFTGERKAEVWLNTEDFGGLLNEDNLAVVKDAVTKNYKRQPNTRAIYVDLPIPREAGGRRWVRLYIKGIVFDEKETIISHSGDGFDSESMFVDEDGGIDFRKSSSPEGGMSFRKAVNEYRSHSFVYHNRYLKREGVLCAAPLGYGVFPNAHEFEGDKLGFVILGIDDMMPQERMMDPDPEFQGHLTSVLQYAGVHHPYLHLGNISRGKGGVSYVHDMDGVEIFDPEISQQKRVLASYISEIAYFYRIFIRDILEAPDTKVNEAVKRSFRSNFNRYISAYFEDVFGKGSHFGEEIISFFEKRFSGAEHILYSRIEEEAKDLLDIFNLKFYRHMKEWRMRSADTDAVQSVAAVSVAAGINGEAEIQAVSSAVVEAQPKETAVSVVESVPGKKNTKATPLSSNARPWISRIIGRLTAFAVMFAASAAFGGVVDNADLQKAAILIKGMAYPIALMGGVVLSAVTAWLIWKCFTVELDDDVRKMLKEKEETTDTVSKPPLFDPSVIVCEKHKEAIFSKIRMDEPIKSGVKRHLAKSWFGRTFIDRRRMLLMPYYDNKANEIRAGALIEIFKWRGTTYVIYMGGKQTEPHRIAEEVIRLDVVSADPGRVVFVFDENAAGGKDIHEKFARIFPDIAVLFPSHVRAEVTSSDHEALTDKATGGLAAISRPAFIAYKKMRPSFEKRRQVYAEALSKSYVYEYGEKFWWTQTFVKQLMIGAFLGVIIKHAESIGVLGTYSFVQYIAQVAVPLIVIQVVMKKITGIVLHRWDRRQSGRTGVWDEMVRGDEAESSIRRTFFAMALINTVARLLFFALIPRTALAGTFGSSALFALGPGQYLTALLGWFLIEAVADVIIAEYWKEAAAGRLQYSEESVKKRLAGFFPTIEGMSSVLTNLTAGSALLVGAGIIGMGFTQALVPILIGSSAVLIISGYYLPNRMREYDHTLSIKSDLFLPMKEENRIWWSDDMTMEFNPNDVRIWSTARPLKDGHGGSWLPWLEELEMILRYREKPDIDLPVIRGKDRRDPVVRLSRVHGKVDKADIWRNVVERKVDGMHQVIICPSWQKRLIYHVAEPDNFLAGYLRAKFASGASSQRLQDAEQLLLKVPEREWDSFESAFKKELFNNGEELLQALRRGPSGRTARALEMLRRSLDSLEQVWLAYYMMEPDGILDRYLKDSSGVRAPPEKIRELACQISRLSDKKLKPLLDDLGRLGFKRLSDIVDAIGLADDKRHGEIINALARFVEATFPDRSKQAASPAVPEIPISTAIKAADDNPAPSPKTAEADFSQFWLRADDVLDEKIQARDLLASAISSCLNKKVVLAFDINICAARSARMLAVIEVLKELKKDERYKTLLKNLEIIKSVPGNLPSRLAGYIDEGAEVFTFARASERNALQAIEPKVHACYIDTPAGLSEDVYIPLPEIVTMVLGQYLKAWKTEDFKPILDKINIRSIDLGETGGAIIFTVLPYSERFNTDEDIVKHCALIKQFLVSV